MVDDREAEARKIIEKEFSGLDVLIERRPDEHMIYLVNDLHGRGVVVVSLPVKECDSDGYSDMIATRAKNARATYELYLADIT